MITFQEKMKFQSWSYKKQLKCKKQIHEILDKRLFYNT